MKTFMETINGVAVNPTAHVYINGLAILCFSKRFNRAEVGFLQVKDHPLLFTIYDKNCEPKFGTPLVLHSGTTIKINHNNPGLGKLYTPDDGDEPNNSDNRDFRHLLNIDKLHDEIFNSNRVEIKPNFYLAKLYLSNGIFFCAERSKHKAKIINARVRPGRPPIRKPLPRVGRVIGTDIFSNEILIDISSLSQPLPPLKREDGPYKVVIRYKCNRTSSIKTDFEKFYNVLELPTNHEALDLEFDDKEPIELLDCEKHFLEAFNEEKFGADSDSKRIFSLFHKNLLRAEEACQAAVKPLCPGNLQGIPEPCS